MRKIGQSHWALTSWDSVNCSDVEYLVEIIGQIQNSPHALMEVSSYWVSSTYFEFPMPCSTAFNITVRSRNRAGVGEPSSAFTGITGSYTTFNHIFKPGRGEILNGSFYVIRYNLKLIIKLAVALEEKAK